MVARTRHELEGLRRANLLTACLLRELAERARPGVRTRDLDAHATAYIRRVGGEAVFHTQNDFPASINTSINEEAVHGVPGDRVLLAGDLLKIDCGMRVGEYCGDSTVTLVVGEPDSAGEERRAVLDAARTALQRGIKAVRVGGRIGDVGEAMQSYVEGLGFNLLPQYTGHGLGRRLWEAPHVPAVGKRGTGPRIVEGLVFTIEPIVVAGSPETYVAADGWTVVTRDGRPAAQFEHTVVAARRGPRVLSVCAQ
jgi:methionyl aminopeptidase